MSNPAAQVITFGAHQAQFIPPDQLHFFIGTHFEEADADAYLECIFQSAQQSRTPIYALYDVTRLSRIAETARTRLVKVARPYPFGGLAVMVSSFSVRVLVDMILRAGRIVASDRFDFPHRFVSSVDEANAWFDELRKKGS